MTGIIFIYIRCRLGKPTGVYAHNQLAPIIVPVITAEITDVQCQALVNLKNRNYASIEILFYLVKQDLERNKQQIVDVVQNRFQTKYIVLDANKSRSYSYYDALTYHARGEYISFYNLNGLSWAHMKFQPKSILWKRKRFWLLRSSVLYC